MSTATIEERVKEKTKRIERERTGAQVVVDVLNEAGVEYIFSHTGGAVIPIEECISKCYDKGIPAPKRIMFAQEPGAGHAAEGYARVTGKPGVALATSGPGATNLMTPIKDAGMDSTPCIFLTGQVSSRAIGLDSFQENNTIGMAESAAKNGYLVKSIERNGNGNVALEEALKSAFYEATTGRLGPVVVDICKDALLSSTEERYDRIEHQGYKKPCPEMNKRQADKILEALASSEKPVILAGGGVITGNASRELYQFASRYSLPVILTFMGSGAIPHDDHLFLGMPGMHGTATANYSLYETDFILNIGSRFDDRVVVKGFGRKADTAHIDIDRSEIGKVIDAKYPLNADAKDFLDHANKSNLQNMDLSRWWKQIEEWKEKYPLSYEHTDDIIKPQYVIEQISEATNGMATITTGVGQHQMWAVQYYNFQEPRQWVSSGGLGTMGFGFPAAIGAYLGNPDRAVVCITGDGSFKMNQQELETVARYNLPIKIFIIENGHFGMVRQWEDMSSGYHEETHLKNPDFVKIAEANRIKGERITKPKDVRPAIERALDEYGPYLTCISVDEHENVRPMIPAGGSISDIIVK